jgi:SAM-dependent methyltransferase
MNELGIMADALRPDPRVLVDLACGAGGPGCWMARELGARLVGVDLSTAALTRASELAGAVGLGDRAEFHLGSFGATGLETASTDAVMSVDALQYAPDKAAAFAEAARILRPGGRMAFAAFELEPDRVAGVPVWEVDPIADYRPLCERAGLVVTSYAETSGWRHRVEAAFSAVVAERARLEAELGETAGAVLAFEASLTLELQPYRRRVLAVATNR